VFQHNQLSRSKANHESNMSDKKKRINFSVVELIKTTFSEYFAETVFRHAAALAYYTIFSLIPIIYLIIYFLGRFLGNDTVHEIISHFLHEQVGIQNISEIMGLLKFYDVEKRNVVMEIVGIGVLLFSSSAFVVTLQKSINDFFGLQLLRAPVKKMILRTVFTRLLAVAFIGGFGVIVILIYFSQTILISISKDLITNPNLQFLFRIGLAHVASIFTNFLVFTLMFKYVHDAVVTWRAAMFGAFVTAVLVYLGQVLIKFYLNNFFFAANSGVVGSLFVILAWIFYTGQILFLGAKFVKVYAQLSGYPIRQRGGIHQATT